ncbi:MAG TPA: RecX family transcriptional regulator [Bryobacteraceae bacterium]|nr:RecX family transcriptional regulator [Bryobacteraceae bacterium]
MRTRVQPKLDNEGLWNYAARLLSGRALTIGELREKLAGRAAEATDVEDVLSRLKQVRVLNDRQFADSYSAVRRDGSGFGKGRVLRELANRKVPKLVAEEAVSAAYAEVDEVDHAIAFLKRKLRITDPAEYFREPKHVQSAFRKLRYNGFSSNAAVKALRQWSSDVEAMQDEPGDD